MDDPLTNINMVPQNFKKRKLTKEEQMEVPLNMDAREFVMP